MYCLIVPVVFSWLRMSAIRRLVDTVGGLERREDGCEYVLTASSVQMGRSVS